jgi:hypothetical protein
MRTIGIVVLLIFLSFLSLFGQSDKLSNDSQVQEVTELEKQRATAVVDRNIDLLDKITAADSVRISPMAELGTKAQLLAELKSGDVTYSSINVDDLSVRIYGKTAVVTGRSAFEGQRQGKQFKSRCRFSRVWVKSGTGWQEILFQLTPISEH